MSTLPETDPEPRSWWLLWLDLWALSPRNPGIAAVRQKFDERWRETIRSTVLAGQEAGEFAAVDVDDLAITLSSLLDGLAVQIALEDSEVPDTVNQPGHLSVIQVADRRGSARISRRLLCLLTLLGKDFAGLC